jgi:oligopeptide transport system substrate-binding protein
VAAPPPRRRLVMSSPRITGSQLELLAERLAAVGVGRRGFLRIAAGLAALGAAGFNRPPAYAAPQLGAGEKLAKDQHLRYGGGGWFQNDPASHDFNKDLYCAGVPALFAGLMKVDADFRPVLDVAEKVTANKDGSVWVFTIRKTSRWSDGGPCSARDFEYSWKRQLDPVSAAPYASFLYDIKNAEAFNKKQVTDPSQVGVKAKDDWTLEVTLEGPRGYFPVLTAYLAALPGHKASIEKYGDKWTEAANIVSNGPFVLEAWEHNKAMVLRKNKHFHDAKNVTLDKVTIPIIPVASGALPYENSEIDLTALQTGDLRRLQSAPATQKEVFKYPFPGTWYLLPQVTKPPFDNPKVRRAVGHAVDRENVVKVAQGFAMPAHCMIPPGFPGHLDDKKIRDLQKFDPKAALAALKGTPYEGGKNWPRIALSMRDEALGSKPLAEAVQAVLLENLNMKTELEVLEQRVFRERLWKQDLQFVWIRWFMDYPDPHNEYFDTFYGKKTTGKRQAWTNAAFDKELEAGRDTRDPKTRLVHYAKAEELLQTDAGYVPVAWILRWAAGKPKVRGLEKNKQGEYVVEGNIYFDMLRHIYIVDKA